jgi:hypothetical protein
MSGYQQYGQGEAANYYNGTGQPATHPPQNGQYNNAYKPQYEQPPSYEPTSEKQDFEQVFRLEGPKYHDVWAGVLVSLGPSSLLEIYQKLIKG